MPSRGESRDADPVRLDPELIGVAPHIAQRALGVVERRGVVIARTQPVLEHEPGDPARVHPLGDLLALEVHREIPVSSAGADHYRGAGGPWRRREINAQGRAVQILRTDRAGSALGPQQFDAGGDELGVLGSRGCGQQQQGSGKFFHSRPPSGQIGRLASTMHQATAPIEYSNPVR